MAKTKFLIEYTATDEAGQVVKEGSARCTTYASGHHACEYLEQQLKEKFPQVDKVKILSVTRENVKGLFDDLIKIANLEVIT